MAFGKHVVLVNPAVRSVRGVIPNFRKIGTPMSVRSIRGAIPMSVRRNPIVPGRRPKNSEGDKQFVREMKAIEKEIETLETKTKKAKRMKKGKRGPGRPKGSKNKVRKAYAKRAKRAYTKRKTHTKRSKAIVLRPYSGAQLYVRNPFKAEFGKLASMSNLKIATGVLASGVLTSAIAKALPTLPFLGQYPIAYKILIPTLGSLAVRKMDKSLADGMLIGAALMGVGELLKLLKINVAGATFNDSTDETLDEYLNEYLDDDVDDNLASFSDSPYVPASIFNSNQSLVPVSDNFSPAWN